VTYPPQQPGPYGPQQPPTGGNYVPPSGGYPPPGYPPPGYPQQGYPQQLPPGYQQPGYPQGGPGFPGYPGGQPPKKSSPAPWILGGVGALVLVVVLVGGFAWPGWFTSDSNSSSTGPVSSAAGSGSGGGGSAGLPRGHNSGVGKDSAAELFAAVSTAAGQHDEAAIKALACPNAEIRDADQLVTAGAVTQQGPVTNNGPHGALVELRAQLPDSAELYGVSTTDQLTGKWCVASITDGGPAS
jgi:hypothetical protein